EIEALFPFHPAAARAIVALSGTDEAVAPAARLAREALLDWRRSARPGGLIWPAELLAATGVRTAIEALLGERGLAARAIARSAAQALDEPRRALAGEIVELLALHHVTARRQPLTLEELGARLSVDADRGAVETPRRVALGGIAAELARRSAGVICFDSLSAELRFNEGAAGAPEVAAFNAALGLSRRFDATLEQAGELADVHGASDRLRAAMADALESAARNRDLLRRAARHSGATLTPEQEQTFADFIAIAEAGPPDLIATARDAERRAALIQTLDDYALLAALAAAVPRLRAMREYLEAMGLHRELEDDPNRDPAVAKLETECKLLLVGADAAVRARTASGLDALESRFQRFKWTYVPHYRAAHEAWRQEMEAAAALVGDAERHLAALAR
ncbi:MAG: hypothetical protein ACREQD_14095, partial [Candidatus Binataceae bacterium]